MKATQEKIQLAELFNCYSLQHLEHYRRCPKVLADEMKDLETLTRLAHSQFAEIVVDLRKKSLEYDKTFKVWGMLAKEINMNAISTKLDSNKDFAYSIHSMSGQSLVPQFPQRRLLTELKLKFLESEEVDESNWENWFCPEEKVLLIKDRSGEFQVNLGIGIADKDPTLSWRIYDVKFNSLHHDELFCFMIEYVEWMRTALEDWESKLINKIQLILDNLPTIFLLLAMREDIRKRGGELERETLKLAVTKPEPVKYTWKFQIFEHIEAPEITFFINEEESFQFKFQKGCYSGDIYLKLKSQTYVLTPFRPIPFIKKHFLFDFSMKIHKYRTIAEKFQEKYQVLNSSYAIFLSLQGYLWRSSDLTLREQDIVTSNSDGIWGQIIRESGVIFKIEEDMSLSYPEFQRGYFGYLLSQMALQHLLLHIHLRNEISKNNKEFEFKIYRISLLEKEKEMVYEFRSYKYIEHQKIFKMAKADQQSNKNITEANNNFFIILRVAVDFTRVNYTVYKATEGPQQEKIVTDCFLPKRWKDYRDNNKSSRFDWRKICECISYLCKCYLVERSYHRRMTEQQKKMTVYSFK